MDRAELRSPSLFSLSAGSADAVLALGSNSETPSLASTFFAGLKDMFEQRRLDSVAALAALGSREGQDTLRTISLSNEHEGVLRRRAIESASWDGRTADLTWLIRRSEDIDVVAATVYAGLKTSMSDQDRAAFEGALLEALVKGGDEVPIAVIFEYFGERGNSRLQTALAGIDASSLSPELKQHIAFILEGSR